MELTEEQELAIQEEMEEEIFQTTLDIQVRLDKSGLVRFEINEKVEGFVLDKSRIVKENTSEGVANLKDFLRLLEYKFVGVRFPLDTTK